VLGILGDGLFAVWKALVEQADPEQRALRAALALTERLRVFEQRAETPAVRTRIGLHSGVACVGNFGSANHFAYRAIGDMVNLASRLNGLNKHLGPEILVSRDFQQGLDGRHVRTLGIFRFKGFDQAVEVFQPHGLGTPATPGDSRPSEDPCDRGIRLLSEGRLREALQAFQSSMTDWPHEGHVDEPAVPSGCRPRSLGESSPNRLSTMQPDRTDASRRTFLSALGLAALGTTTPIPIQAADQALTAPLQANGADLGSLSPLLQKLAETNQYSDSFLDGRFRSFAEFQTAARAKLFEWLLYRPAPVDPLGQVVERVDCGEYTREKIVFSTTPLLRVPAYVLIPKNLKTPAPAIVDLHSHGGMFLFGKEKVIDLGADNHPAMVPYHQANYEGRPTATALARRGYVGITIDAFMFGERRILMDSNLEAGWNRADYSMETVSQLNQQCRSKESTLVKALTFAGMTWPGIVFWDDLRTVDYLVSRPEVDAKRLGCVGVSMGGYRSLFLAALDPRIRAACVTGFMSTVRPMIHAHLDTHSWIHFLPGLHRHLDWPDVAALAAPRSLLVQQCAKDGLFPPSGMKEALEKIATLFDRAGTPERFTGRFYDTPHQFTRSMQDDAFAWFDRELA